MDSVSRWSIIEQNKSYQEGSTVETSNMQILDNDFFSKPQSLDIRHHDELICMDCSKKKKLERLL